MSVTDFGAEGPRASWTGTDPVFYAMSTALSRSGPTTGRPVLPPEGLASATAAVQAAWAALVAYYHRLRYGTGDYIDFSRFEAVVQCAGSAVRLRGSGRRRAEEIRRAVARQTPKPADLPDVPVSRRTRPRSVCCRRANGVGCGPGSVNLSSSPIRSSRRSPPATPHPTEINALIGRSVRHRRRWRSWSQRASRRGSADRRGAQPCGDAGLASISGRSARSPRRNHRTRRRRDGAGRSIRGRRQPRGFARPGPAVDARRSRLDRAAVRRARTDRQRACEAAVRRAADPRPRRHRRGRRTRQAVRRPRRRGHQDRERRVPGRAASDTARSGDEPIVGVDPSQRIRARPGSAQQPEGAEIFSRLVADADAVFANFKPGTLPSLGFPYERLRELNPRIVLAESSAFGATGPWSARMGYGPLVRATTGVTKLWTSEDDPGFYDATTIFPDHVVARITAVAALASLIGSGSHRNRCARSYLAGRGGRQPARRELCDRGRPDRERLAVADDDAACTPSSVCGRGRMVRDLASLRRGSRRFGRCHGQRPRCPKTAPSLVAAVSRVDVAVWTRARSPKRSSTPACLRRR